MLKTPIPLHNASKEGAHDHNISNKANTDTESVATLCSPLLEAADSPIVFRNASTKTVVAPSTGTATNKKYSLDSPSLQRGNKTKLSGTHHHGLSGKTAVSNNAFSNGIRTISEISLFGLPGSYRVSSNPYSPANDLNDPQYVDNYNISSPGINISDIYEEVSFDSNGSFNLQLQFNDSNERSYLDVVDESPLSMVSGRSKLIYSFPDTSLHEEKFIKSADLKAGAHENIEDVLKSVRKELLFEDENKYNYNTEIFGQDLNKKDYQMSDSDKVKNILSFEMGYKNNFITDKIKSMEEMLYELKKDLHTPTDFFKSYISSFVCTTTSTNYFLLKQSIKVANKSPWCLFEENFWANYEEDHIEITKPVVLEYPTDQDDEGNKIDDDFEKFLEKEDQHMDEQGYEMETIKGNNKSI